MNDLSLQAQIYIACQGFYIFVAYFALKALFEIRDHLLNKSKTPKIIKPVRKKK